MMPKVMNRPIITVAGCGAVVALIVYQGASQVWSALAAAGWRLWLVPLFHVLPLLLYGLGWHVLLARTWFGGLWAVQIAAWLREAGNTLLPLPQIGGELLGARLLTLSGAPAALACASIVVDLTLIVATQIVLTVVSLALLIGAGHFDAPVRGFALAVGMCIPIVVAFFLAQQWGVFRYFERQLQRAATKRPEWGLNRFAGLDEAIQHLYGNRRAVAVSAVLHLGSWLLTAVEVWIVLRFMGLTASLGEAVAIYGIGSAVRSIAVLIPSGLGVQEISLMYLVGVYGFPAAAGLAVSLALRFREIVFGIPVLLWWSVKEGHRVFAVDPGKHDQF